MVSNRTDGAASVWLLWLGVIACHVGPMQPDRFAREVGAISGRETMRLPWLMRNPLDHSLNASLAACSCSLRRQQIQS